MTTDLCKLTGRDKNRLVQLCQPLRNLKTPLKFPLLASEKLDGVFCLARYNPDYENPDEKVTIYSRTGEVYTSMEHLKEDLRRMLYQTGTDFIIFEAYVKGVSQPTISGWCRDTKNQHLELKAFMHDCLSLDEFNGKLDTPYIERLSFLEEEMENGCYPNLYVCYTWWINTPADLERNTRKILADGGEGIVLREPDAPYCPGKRNATMIKVKQGVSFDLKVVVLEEGKGKYKGMVGKLICRWKNGESIKVGSGLNDTQRKDWWTEFAYDDIVGKIVQIDAMAVSSKGKLREPIFKGIRYDKTEGDY